MWLNSDIDRKKIFAQNSEYDTAMTFAYDTIIWTDIDCLSYDMNFRAIYKFIILLLHNQISNIAFKRFID